MPHGQLKIKNEELGIKIVINEYKYKPPFLHPASCILHPALAK